MARNTARMRLLLGLAPTLAMLLVACGDDGTGTYVGSSTSGSSSGASTGGGGDGGDGGSPPCNNGPVVGSFDTVHGCTVETAVDRRCEAEVTVDGGYIDSKFQYLPKCLLVSAGTTVTINNADGTNFQIHPLRGGVQGQGKDPASPFGFVNDSELKQASFELNTPGSYPYICVAHAGSGMIGVVYVE